MAQSIHSNKWMYTMRILYVLGTIFQTVILAWAGWVTMQVIQYGKDLAAIKVQLQYTEMQKTGRIINKDQGR